MPKIVDHDERRTDLARAALGPIAESGVDRVTLRDVADAAGCTTGMLTHYFQDKDELLLAALGVATQSAAERIEQRAAVNPGDLRGVLAESLPLDDERRLEWRIWLNFWGRATADEQLTAEQRVRYRAWHQALTGILNELSRARRLVAKLDLDEVADQLMALVDGVGIRASFDEGGWPPDRQLHHVDLYLDTVLRKPKGPSSRSSSA